MLSHFGQTRKLKSICKVWFLTAAVVLSDIIRSDVALDKQKGCKLASHPGMMLELQREKAASTQLVLLKEQLSNIYSNITLTGRRLRTPDSQH